MNVSRFFAPAVFAASLLISPPSSAATVNYYSDGNYVDASTYAPVDTLLAARARASSTYEFDFGEYGSLGAYTQVVYTFTASIDPSKISEDSYISYGGSFDGNWTGMDINRESTPAEGWEGTLPVLVMASFDSGILTTKVSIANATNEAADFDAYFSGMFQAIENEVFSGIRLMVTAETSAVPLPPAVLLFASGIALAGGLAKRKRARA